MNYDKNCGLCMYSKDGKCSCPLPFWVKEAIVKAIVIAGIHTSLRSGVDTHEGEDCPAFRSLEFFSIIH